MTNLPPPDDPRELARRYADLRGEDALLAALIVTKGFASQEDVTMALEEQERVFQAEGVLPARIGEVLIEAELITPEQLAQLQRSPGERPTAAWLVLETADGFGRPFPLGPRAEIGRLSTREIPLRDAQVSRSHALIRFDAPTGTHVISDSGSRNGTQVNHSAVQGPVSLQSGDVVRIGGTMLRYVSIASEPSIPEGETQVIAHVAPPPPPPPPPEEDVLEGDVVSTETATDSQPPPPQEELLEGEIVEAEVVGAPPPPAPPEQDDVLDGEVVHAEAVSQLMRDLPENALVEEQVFEGEVVAPEISEPEETSFESAPTPPPMKIAAPAPPPPPHGAPDETEHDDFIPAPPPRPRLSPDSVDDAEAAEAARRTGRPVSDFQRTLLDNPVVPATTRHKPPPAAAPPPAPPASAPPPMKVKLSFDQQEKPSLLDRAARLRRNRRFRR